MPLPAQEKGGKMLKTEMRNERTMHIDTMPMADAIRIINDENRVAVEAVEAAVPEIEAACRAITESIKKGGRVFYIGAGTSGRLGVLDASECPPTYGVPKDLFNGIIAGGDRCMFVAGEAAEDSPSNGEKDLRDKGMSAGDVVVGISASGGAPYVVGALKYARENGAVAVAVVNNTDTPMQKAANIAIVLDTGAEAVTGSTRMKAGTSQKIVLNMLSTVSLIHCGCVYENMMINLKPGNQKLKRRMVSIVSEILDCDFSRAERLLEEHSWNIRSAVENR